MHRNNTNDLHSNNKQNSWRQLLEWIDVTTCKANSSLMRTHSKTANSKAYFIFAGLVDNNDDESKIDRMIYGENKHSFLGTFFFFCKRTS